MVYTLIARLIVLMTAIPFHEAAHAYAAYLMGDKTALDNGRVSLNPLEHIDPIGGLMILFMGFGWAKPVTVNAYNFHDRDKGMMCTALAGPAANILLAFISLMLYKAVAYGHYLLSWDGFIILGLLQVLGIMVTSNIGLAVFNLIPIPPLDGWNAFSHFLPSDLRWKVLSHQREITMVLIFCIFFGLLNTPISFFVNLIYSLLSKMTYFIDFGMMLLF